MKYFYLVLLTLPLLADTQNYYRDIMGTRETNDMMKLYKRMKVSTVTSKGYDEYGMPVSSFTEKQEVDTIKSLLRISRSYENRVSSEWLYFDSNDRLVKHIDSSGQLVSLTNYTYNSSGKITSIHNTTIDTAININESEWHFWQYNTEGIPVKMIRVMNKTDTTEFRMLADESGNIIEETAYKRNIPGEKVYYYYNDNNQLTDVVRYNRKVRKLLPDFMFEYSESGQVVQKITTMSNPKIGYLIWRYQFGTNGLKQREINYNKDKKMIGRIDYAYAFAK